MYNLIKLDLGFFYKSIMWRLFIIFFMILFLVQAIVLTIDASKSTEVYLGGSMFYMTNIFSYLIIVGPFSKGRTSSNSGMHYSKLIFSLPISKRNIINGKYILFLFYTTITTMYLLLISYITCLIIKSSATTTILLNVSMSTLCSFFIFGSLYILLFFATKYYTSVSTVIYIISIVSYIFYKRNDVLIFNNIYLVLLFGLISISLSYLISSIFCRYRSF